MLLGGHARVGSWVAIAVHLKNDGPAIDGELRIAGGTQSQTRFSVPADLPTQADKTFLLYAQPPAFGKDLQVQLVEGDTTVAVGQGHLRIRRRHPAGRRRRRRASRAARRQLPPAAQPEPGRTPRHEPRTGGPAGTGRGVDLGRPDRLAGRRRRPPDHGPAGRPQRLGRRRREAGHRRRDDRTQGARRVPGRAAALPAGRHHRRPRGQPRRHPGRAAADRDDPAGPVRRARLRPGARHGRRPGRRRGTDIRRRHRDPPRVRPVGRLDREDRQLAGDVAAPAATAHLRRPGHLRRQPAGRRRVPGAEPRAAADRWPDPPPHRLHRPDRADQLLRPATARSSRVGVADDAAADRGLRRRGVWLRVAPARQRGDRQRDRDRARRLGRDGRLRAGLPRASSRRRARPTS